MTRRRRVGVEKNKGGRREKRGAREKNLRERRKECGFKLKNSHFLGVRRGSCIQKSLTSSNQL